VDKIANNGQIRAMEVRDIPEVMKIESEQGVSSWTAPKFESALRAGDSGVVIESDDSLIGFILVKTISGVCEILTIGVSPDVRRQGIGVVLLEYVLRDVDEAILEVRRSNAAAIGLYERMGFTECGVRKGYYNNGGEDAIVMKKSASSRT